MDKYKKECRIPGLVMYPTDSLGPSSKDCYLPRGHGGPHDWEHDYQYFTPPEPININELKRLLCELVDDIVEETITGITTGDNSKRKNLKEKLWRKIDNAILDGDDS